jgi:SPOR domain
MANTIEDSIGDEPVDYVAGAHDEALETERLALNDEEERLPWLESADDDYADTSGDENRRLIAFVLMGLIALAAIVGGLWWATNRAPDPALVADGSTINAPEGPYKEAPKDPGGKKMAGTGDTSFAVSEGHNRPAQLGSGASASPSVDLGKPGVAAPAAPQGGVGVQVGAYSSQAAAEAGWSRLAQQHSALSGVSHRVQQGQADIGTVYRLQAVTSDAAAAQALCGKLKSGGVACQVK